MELNGYGSGYGYGYGYGDGSGYGGGSGYGYGYGYGDGYGDGYGSGSGYGYGDGDGCGTGDGDEFIHALLRRYPTPTNARCALWRSDADGKPCNGGGGEPRRVGMVEETTGNTPCQSGMLHGTLTPQKWKGSRLWVVALYEPVTVVDEDKMASRKREIVAEIPNFYEERK